LSGDAQRIEQLGWMLFLKIFSDKELELELINEGYKSPIPSERFGCVLLPGIIKYHSK
jgi:type I restriction enzyme M protein